MLSQNSTGCQFYFLCEWTIVKGFDLRQPGLKKSWDPAAQNNCLIGYWNGMRATRRPSPKWIRIENGSVRTAGKNNEEKKVYDWSRAVPPSRSFNLYWSLYWFWSTTLLILSEPILCSRRRGGQLKYNWVGTPELIPQFSLFVFRSTGYQRATPEVRHGIGKSNASRPAVCCKLAMC